MIKVLVWNGKRHEEVRKEWGGLVEVFKAYPSTVYYREVLEETNKTVIFVRPKI